MIAPRRIDVWALELEDTGAQLLTPFLMLVANSVAGHPTHPRGIASLAGSGHFATNIPFC